MNLDLSRLDLSIFDGMLGALLLIVIVWAALKLAARALIAIVLIVLIGVGFFAMHWDDFTNAAENVAEEAERIVDGAAEP